MGEVLGMFTYFGLMASGNSSITMYVGLFGFSFGVCLVRATACIP